MFGAKVLAEKWARRVKSDIDSSGGCMLPKRTLPIGAPIRRYPSGIEGSWPFGRNKAYVLRKLKHFLENLVAHAITAERIIDYIRKERRISGITAGIDLIHLKGVFKLARGLWRLPVHPGVLDEAHDALRHMGQLERGAERDRWPTVDELTRASRPVCRGGPTRWRSTTSISSSAPASCRRARCSARGGRI